MEDSLKQALLPALAVALLGWIALRAALNWRLRTRLPQLVDPNSLVIDVRSRVDYLNAERDGSVNLPLEQLGSRLEQLDRDRPILLCCEKGVKSEEAKSLLKQNGFKNVENAGSCERLYSSS